MGHASVAKACVAAPTRLKATAVCFPHDSVPSATHRQQRQRQQRCFRSISLSAAQAGRQEPPRMASKSTVARVARLRHAPEAASAERLQRPRWTGHPQSSAPAHCSFQSRDLPEAPRTRTARAAATTAHRMADLLQLLPVRALRCEGCVGGTDYGSRTVFTWTAGWTHQRPHDTAQHRRGSLGGSLIPERHPAALGAGGMLTSLFTLKFNACIAERGKARAELRGRPGIPAAAVAQSAPARLRMGWQAQAGMDVVMHSRDYSVNSISSHPACHAAASGLRSGGGQGRHSERARTHAACRCWLAVGKGAAAARLAAPNNPGRA